MITIGKTYIIDPTTKKRRMSKYSDINLLEGSKPGNHWVDLNKYKPYPFDAVYLKIDGRSKPISGWWDEKKWIGLRLRPHHTLTHWKRIIYYD